MATDRWLLLPLLVFEIAVAAKTNLNAHNNKLLSDRKFFDSKPNSAGTSSRQWAILVAGSKTYVNYRHQADICHAYQLLRDRGMRKERIVVMMYDDIANSTENPTPGVVFNHPDGPDVYQGVPKDYTGDLVTPENFLQILQGGTVNGGSGKVISSRRDDHIFVFFSGHGGPGVLDFPNGGVLKGTQLIKAIIKMRREQRFRRMVIYVDACFSGSLFDRHLPSNLNVYAMTAARGHQNSYSCYWDSQRDVYLGDEYSVSWMEHCEDRDPIAMSLRNVFSHVHRTTNESDVMEYGDTSFASLKISMFLGKKNKKPVPRRKVPCGPSSNENVAISILRNKLANTREPTKRKNLEKQLQHTLNNRDFLKRKVAQIATFIAREQEDIIKSLLSSVKTTENTECYEEAVSYFNSKCFSLSDNPYALHHLRVFVNACDSGYPLKVITDAMDAACTHSTIRGCFSTKCRNCDAPKADLTPILSDCRRLKPRAGLHLNNMSDWEAAMSSSDPAIQLRAVTWALEIAEGQGLTATSRRL